jgi:hypothetical protein
VDYTEPLLTDKAARAWNYVAVPSMKAGDTLTWDLFKQTMLTNFARPYRQFKERQKLHHVKQQERQDAADYVHYFNALVQQAGTPTPSVTDQKIYCRAGLLPSLKDKTAVNPANAKFWTDLKDCRNTQLTCARMVYPNLSTLVLLHKHPPLLCNPGFSTVLEKDQLNRNSTVRWYGTVKISRLRRPFTSLVTLLVTPNLL